METPSPIYASTIAMSNGLGSFLDSVEFIVLGLLLLVGSWCDKCVFARGSLRKVVSIACVRESFCVGRIYLQG